jgi:hypothetical protein
LLFRPVSYGLYSSPDEKCPVHNVDIRDVFPTPLKWKTNNTYIHHALKKQSIQKHA